MALCSRPREHRPKSIYTRFTREHRRKPSIRPRPWVLALSMAAEIAFGKTGDNAAPSRSPKRAPCGRSSAARAVSRQLPFRSAAVTATLPSGQRCEGDNAYRQGARRVLNLGFASAIISAMGRCAGNLGRQHSHTAVEAMRPCRHYTSGEAAMSCAPIPPLRTAANAACRRDRLGHQSLRPDEQRPWLSSDRAGWDDLVNTRMM